MCTFNIVFISIVVILCSQAWKIAAADDGDAPHWDYENTTAWNDDYPQCRGKRQSPINLKSTTIISPVIRQLKFVNYSDYLSSPLTLTNNGHTVNMPIPDTVNGERPYISGATLKDKYEAQSLHFHWGSYNTQGSEHTVRGKRHDAEMHIVHKNVKYATTEEAAQNQDGLAVLGVFLEKVDDPDRVYPALNEIFNRLPELVNYQSTATIDRPEKLSHFLGDLDTTEFYTYSGSLTTPPCAEAVTWFVFPRYLPIETIQIQKFFNLLDDNGQPLINNFRSIQDRNHRQILYRRSDIRYPDFNYLA